MYSNYNCHFCNSELASLTNSSLVNPDYKYCNNKNCNYRYTITMINNSWVVTFKIKGYYFQMFNNVFNKMDQSLELVCPNSEIIAIPECRMITLENYLEEVERARKLQVFR